MKEKMTRTQGVERKGGVRWKLLPTAVLLYALSLPQEGYAKSLSGMDEGKIATEVVQKDIVPKETAIMPDGFKVKGDDGVGIELDPDKDDGIPEGPDTEGGDGKGKLEGPGKTEGKDVKGGIDVHGMVRGGSDVTPLLGSVLSDKPALLLSIDASHPKTGLGLTVTRCDDFDKSMDSSASQITILDFYWQKKFGKASVMLDGEYTTIDKLPGAESFTPIVGCTYDAGKGRGFDVWGGHTFQKGKDGDVVRLGVTKMLTKSLSLAMQAFYSSELSKKIYGRVQADITLGKGFGVQLSFIAKEGKLTPTSGVFYKF